jgi:hypothetical protein
MYLVQSDSLHVESLHSDWMTVYQPRASGFVLYLPFCRLLYTLADRD